MVGIEDDFHIVILAVVEVPFHFAGNNLPRLTIVAPDPNVERTVIVENGYLGALRHGLAVGQFPLGEVGNFHGPPPSRFVQLPVERQLLVNHQGCQRVRCAVLRPRTGGTGQADEPKNCVFSHHLSG